MHNATFSDRLTAIALLIAMLAMGFFGPMPSGNPAPPTPIPGLHAPHA